MAARTTRRRRKLRFVGLRKAVSYVRRAGARGLVLVRGRLTAQGGWVEVAS